MCDFIKISKICAAFLISYLILNFLVSCKPQSNTISFEAMDTFMTIRSNGKTSRQAEKANFLAQKRVEELELLLSTTKNDSEIYRLNHRNQSTVQINQELESLIKFALQGAERSNGHFNPVLFPVTSAWGFTTKKYTVPSEDQISTLLQLTDYTKIQINENQITLPAGMMFDFGAIGKGYAGDEIIEILRGQGISSAVLDLGGNVQTLGTKPDGSKWTIGLKNPWGGEVPVVLRIQDCAVITSGGYERHFTGDDGNQYIHIFDGKTGYPVENNLVSSTIITEKGLYGDYLSTTTFILGKEETIDLWKKSSEKGYADFEFILMFDDYSMCYSAGLEDCISVLGNFSAIEVIEK